MTGGTHTQANGTTTGAPLPFDAKLENELASAPKGLILIVKEPGESKLIAGKVNNTWMGVVAFEGFKGQMKR